MPDRSSKRQKDTQELARSILDQAVPDAEPDKKPASNKAKPPRPAKKQDVKDIERADSEGMAQPQDTELKEKNPAAVALGRLGGLKGGKARAKKLTKEQRSEIAKKAAAKRWNKEDD